MDENLKELYNDTVTHHQKKPRNFRVNESANLKAEGQNPLCGDEIFIYIQLINEIVEDISFQGKGCAICVASASMMTHRIKGKSSEEAVKIFEDFHQMILGKSDTDVDERLGHLKEVFGGVPKFPVRVKCASLPWHTMNAALHGESEVSTE
jgi:nitrogen fixation NifU-like protein